MPARFRRLLVPAALCTIVFALACKSDSGITSSASESPIPNPSGPLNLNDVVSVNVNGDSACNFPVYHPAKVVAIGTHALILNDTLNPKNGFTTADFQRFAARFDTLIYPLDVANFGDPTDIDNNGHIIILFTRAVNELTPPRASSYVGGFAFSRDLFPVTATSRAQACAASNQGEYFYLLTPDPAGTINSNVRSVAFVDSATPGVLAHEFQHLINSSRRLYVNAAPAFEEKWLDEGLAHIAEELLFYHEAGATPRLNLDYPAIRANARISNAFNADMSGNAGRYRTWLQQPSNNSPYALFDSLTTRGAAWSLLRYSADRLNAADGFTAGPGQAVSGSGDLVAGPGEWAITIVNTSVARGSLTGFTLRTAVGPATATIPNTTNVPNPRVDNSVPVAPASLVAVGTSSLQPDAQFESRLRDRERALTPRMGAARSWYASREVPQPSVFRSRASFSTSVAADADASTWFALVNSKNIGIANLQGVFNNNVVAYLRDWAVSNAVDDIAAPRTEYQQRSWNWHSIYPNLAAGGYPLLMPQIANVTSFNGTVMAGGAAYYKLVVPAGTSTTVSLGAPGAPSAAMQLVLVQTK